MTVPYLIPVLSYAFLAMSVFLFASRARGLKCVLTAGYCGVIVTSFTGGASGAIWLAPLFLYLLSPVILFGSTSPTARSRSVTRWTRALFGIFFFGILVGLFRFDPSVEVTKAGSFTTFMGIPTSMLMAGYRIFILFGLVLAFLLPLRYRVDEVVLRECLRLCWFLALVLSVLGVLDYFGIADTAFSYRREAGYGHVAVLGFHRGALGIMTVTSIFLSFALALLLRGRLLAWLVYLSLPLMLLALLCTWSRAAMLALAFGGVSLVVTLGGSRAAKGLVFGVAAAIVLAVILSQVPELQTRFSVPSEGTLAESSAGRLQGWADLLSWLVRRPDVLVLGVGFQNFHYYVNLASGAVGLEAAHNTFLHILTETGIFGFMVFLGWAFSIIVWLVRWRRDAEEVSQRVAAGVFLSIVLAVLVSCLTQESLAPSFAMLPYLTHFFLILGMFISFHRSGATVPQFETSTGYRRLRSFGGGRLLTSAAKP